MAKPKETFSSNGTLFKLVVFRIIDEDSFGRPRHLEMLADTETVDVSLPENKKFLTAYVPAHMAVPAKKATA